MTTPDPQPLGMVETEGWWNEGSADDLEAGPETTYRPARVTLAGEYRSWYWMDLGESYRLWHDGTSWRVASQTQITGLGRDYRVDRLANLEGEYVSTLPAVDGPVALVPGAEYVLREEHRRRWVVYRVAG